MCVLIHAPWLMCGGHWATGTFYHVGSRYRAQGFKSNQEPLYTVPSQCAHPLPSPCMVKEDGITGLERWLGWHSACWVSTNT